MDHDGRRAAGQVMSELVVALPILIGLLAAMIGFTVALTRHAILHYGVHMATRIAATSATPVQKAPDAIRRVVAVAWDPLLLLPSPSLPIRVTVANGSATVDATYVDRILPPFLLSRVTWQLPVERDVKK